MRAYLRSILHDHVWTSILVPFGILNLQTHQLSIYFGSSAETSDFIIDCLSQWWQDNQEHYRHLEELMIDLDGVQLLVVIEPNSSNVSLS